MFACFFSKPPELEFDPDTIPHEIWSVIFSRLAPSFLFQVFLVCKKFNLPQIYEAVFTYKISQYGYPLRKKDETAYDAYADHYLNQFMTLTVTARKLLAFLYEKDWENIDGLPITPEILQEKDGDGLNLLDHIHRQNNQALRDRIFARMYTRWPAITLLYPVHPHMSYSIYKMAVCLNQLDIVQNYQAERKHPYHYQFFLGLSIRYGHVDVASFIIRERKREWYCGSDQLRMDPLTLAAEHGQPKILLLLMDECESISYLTLFHALNVSVTKNHIETTTILAKALLAKNIHNSAPMMTACVHDNVKQLEILCRYFTIDDLAKKTLLEVAARMGHADVFNFLYQRYMFNAETIELVTHTAIANNQINIVELLLQYGFQPSVFSKQLAQERNHQEIVALFDAAMMVDTPIRKFGF